MAAGSVQTELNVAIILLQVKTIYNFLHYVFTMYNLIK
jgi:hypothetical protein